MQLSVPQKRKRVSHILRILRKLFPDARGTELYYKTGWQLLIAVILSAQCTDKKVNEVTKKLFKKYKTLADIASAKQEDFEKDIYSTGFYRSKARNILAASKILHRKYRDTVPASMGELVALPGVARKTANVVLGNLYGVNEGVTVDTHVIRLSNKLGLTTHKNPVKIEQDLMKLIPRKEWFTFANMLVLYGRHICPAKRHTHDKCALSKFM